MNKIKIDFKENKIKFIINGKELELDILAPDEKSILSIFDNIIVKAKKDCEDPIIKEQLTELILSDKFDHTFLIECEFIKSEQVDASDKIAKDIILNFCTETKAIFQSEFQKNSLQK